MKAKKIIIGVVYLLILGLTACGNSTNSTDKEEVNTTNQVDTKEVNMEETQLDTSINTEAIEEQSTEESVTEFQEEEEENCLKIVSHSISKDYDGKDVLVIEYEWTNTTDKAVSFMTQFRDKVFQNGIECDSSVVGCNDIDSQQQMNDIQPGTTYNVKVGYHLQDNSTANVVVTSLFGDTTYLDENIDLGGGDGIQQQEESDKAETSFSIVSTSISQDYNGDSVLVVEYAFYNGEDKATSFTFACNDKAFQNGVECDSSVVGCTDVDTQQQLNDVQPGNTYNVKVGYHLQDNSQVNIVITDLFGDTEYLNENVDIS